MMYLKIKSCYNFTVKINEKQMVRGSFKDIEEEVEICAIGHFVYMYF